MSATPAVRAVARILLSGIFVSGGLDTLRDPAPKAPKAEALGVPRAEQATRVSGAVMVLAGGGMALGLAPRIAACLLIGTLVPTTVAGHPFWKLEGKDRAMQRIQFLKNAGLLGGLLVVATAPD